MSNRTGTTLDKFIKESDLHKLKASEITKVKNEEFALGFFGCLLFGAVLLVLISIVALVLWFSKVTIFITIVILLLNVPVGLLASKSYRDYVNLVKEITNRIKNEEENK